MTPEPQSFADWRDACEPSRIFVARSHAHCPFAAYMQSITDAAHVLVYQRTVVWQHPTTDQWHERALTQREYQFVRLIDAYGQRTWTPADLVGVHTPC